jgi:hypothetical protein
MPKIAAVKAYVAEQGAEAILCKHWANGSRDRGSGEEGRAAGGIGRRELRAALPDEMPLFQKLQTIAKRIYHADDVIADKSIRDQLKTWEAAGYGHLPICVAKTQYSFTTDPTVRGAPTGHTVPVREVRLSAGAGFIVAICGEIMTMPGLPKVPSAEVIRLNDDRQCRGPVLSGRIALSGCPLISGAACKGDDDAKARRLHHDGRDPGRDRPAGRRPRPAVRGTGGLYRPGGRDQGRGRPAGADRDRVEEVVGNVRRHAEVYGLPPDLVEKLWRRLIDWSIAREESKLGPDSLRKG